jgi:uncharacterized protein DUF4349
MRFVAVVLALTLVGGACQESAPMRDAPASLLAPTAVDTRARGDESAGAAGQARAEAPAEAGIPLFGATDVLPDLIIRTGTASVQVDSLDAAIVLVRSLARRVGGFVAGSSSQAGGGQLRAATLELRVPAGRFDEAVDGLRPLGKVEAVNVTAEDVGEEFVDVQARMTNARRLEARLIDLLARRTGKLGDVLDVEHELARVREEIERYEGRLRYLRSRIAVSTLTLTVHEPIPMVDHGSPGVMAEAARQAWRNFIALVAIVIEALGVVVPLGLVATAGWWAVRRWRRPPTRPAEV